MLFEPAMHEGESWNSWQKQRAFFFFFFCSVVHDTWTNQLHAGGAWPFRHDATLHGVALAIKLTNGMLFFFLSLFYGLLPLS